MRPGGRSAGRGAAAWVRRIKKAGTVTGVGFGVIFGATALLLPFLFSDTTNEVRAMASAGILLYAVAQVVKVRNMTLGAGVLPSAGDVRGVIVGDVVGAFVVGLPLALVLGLHTPLAWPGSSPPGWSRSWPRSSSSRDGPVASGGTC
jgi:Na+-driven multidrug efflux pump